MFTYILDPRRRSRCPWPNKHCLGQIMDVMWSAIAGYHPKYWSALPSKYTQKLHHGNEDIEMDMWRLGLTAYAPHSFEVVLESMIQRIRQIQKRRLNIITLRAGLQSMSGGSVLLSVRGLRPPGHPRKRGLDFLMQNMGTSRFTPEEVKKRTKVEQEGILLQTPIKPVNTRRMKINDSKCTATTSV